MDVVLDPGALAEQLAADVRAGLTGGPEKRKTLPSKYLYDARGSELFDRITRLPEYYPTRAERAILEAHAADIAAASGAHSLVELGSGTSEKTRLLLQALHDAGTLRSFVPFDVDPAVLKDASSAVAAEFPGVSVEPVVGDSRSTSASYRGTRTGSSPSSARRSATSTRSSGPGSWPTSGPRCAPVTRSCSAPTS